MQQRRKCENNFRNWIQYVCMFCSELGWERHIKLIADPVLELIQIVTLGSVTATLERRTSSCLMKHSTAFHCSTHGFHSHLAASDSTPFILFLFSLLCVSCEAEERDFHGPVCLRTPVIFIIKCCVQHYIEMIKLAQTWRIFCILDSPCNPWKVRNAWGPGLSAVYLPESLWPHPTA